ncbi:MAG: META domain-containing protein [Burkholderia sp.]
MKPPAATRTHPSFVRSLRAPLAAISLAALAACTIPTHPDSSAPPSDPFNPAAIQLVDDTSWQLASWRNADGTQRELPQGQPQGQGANGQPAVPTLTLSTADGVRRASGFSGCNRFGDTYAVKNGLLSFGPLAGTRMACPNSVGGRLEAPYLDALAHVTKAGLQMRAPQQLYLVTEDGAALTFSRRDTP